MRLAGSRGDRSCCLMALLLLLALTGKAQAERLPVKTYTTADGLCYNRVKRIVRDSHGFLWFCTSYGLSRFDGSRFTNYGLEDGLSFISINDFIETRDRVCWVATNGGGVCRFNPYVGLPVPVTDQVAALTGSRFILYPVGDNPQTSRVNKLYEDRAGRIWAGTDAGLFYLDRTDAGGAFERANLGVPSRSDSSIKVWDFIEDREGNLWVATTHGLICRLPDGRMLYYPVQPSQGRDIVWTFLLDREGRLWLGHEAGLIVFTPPRLGFAARRYTTADGLGRNDVRVLCQGDDGRLWIGTNDGGLSVFDGKSFRTFTTEHGLNQNLIVALAEDRAGNLWAGTNNGAMKIPQGGFTTYTEADGLGHDFICSIFESPAGELYTITGERRINRLDGRRFTAVRPNLPRHISDSSWRAYQSIIQDHMGEWWVATPAGLYRFPKVTRIEQLARARPKALYTTREGLAGDDVALLFEDRRGDIWIGIFTPGREVLTRWERSTGRFYRYSDADGLPPFNAPSAFCEDVSGNLWIGFREGGLARFAAGRFSLFGASEGAPPSGQIMSIYSDRAGRLWVATQLHGLRRIDDPVADRPRLDAYTVAEGLESNFTAYIAEDMEGRLYFGTVRGVDRLDPATGHIRHYTVDDGLAADNILAAFRDRQGALWFGTFRGISKFIPPGDRAQLPPQVFISGLQVAGVPYTISDLGATEVAGLEFAASQNRIKIGFFGSPGESLRYQYRLEGASQDWSDPSEQRAVDFASLAPGTYRFLVRAVGSDGVMSQSDATVAFTILPPVWRRWWFLTLLATLVGAMIFAFERYRAARVKEVRSALTRSTLLTVKLTVQQDDLRRANQTLALDYAVTSILAESRTLSDATPRILQAICESTGWEIGELWEADPQDGLLRCVDVWHMDMQDAAEFERHSKNITFLPGVGLPGRVLVSGEPLWITDLAADPNFPRMHMAAKEGLRSGFGFPILLGSEVLGVLEFFSRESREHDPDLLAAVSTIGSHIGQLFKRKRGEQELRESESRFRTLAETASDAIITIDERSTIIFANPAAESVFGYTVSEMLGRDLTMLMPEYLRHLHRAGLGNYLQTSEKHLSWASIELPGLHKSGREIPLEISFGEFIRNDRHFFTGVARDITERKRAEEALLKSKEERLAELELVRKRIATDLHDDIGSSLTRISLLSEVASRQVSHEERPFVEHLSLIAGLSRELVDSMSDIVWAINPKKDYLGDLSQRMRHFASDVLTARRIEFVFRAPDAERDVQVGANVRREIFLIFKEGVNNLVRHSGCTKAEIELCLSADCLVLVLSDNGHGFDVLRESSGHGLMSMRERAKELGGTLTITSRDDQGTSVTLTVPLNQIAEETRVNTEKSKSSHL